MSATSLPRGSVLSHAVRARPVTRVSAHLPLLMLLAAAAVLRFAFIGTQGYWFDESLTVVHVQLPLRAMLQELPAGESTPPVYFVLAWFWAHAFGSGEAALRSLSALFSLGTVGVVFAAGQRLGGHRTAVGAALLTAFNPFLIWYGQEARSYALLTLLSAIGLLAFLELRRHLTPRWVLVWTLAAIATLWTHYLGALLVGPELVVLLLAHGRERRMRAAGAAVVLSQLALAPLELHQLHAMGGKANWIHSRPLLPRIEAVPVTFATGYAAPGRAILFSVVAAVVLLAVAALRRRGARTARLEVAPLAVLLGGGVALLSAMLVLGYDELDVRNVIALTLPVLLIVARGLLELRPRWLGLGGIVVICAAGAAAVGGVDLDPSYQRPDWRPVAQALGGTERLPHRAVFVLDGCQGLPLALYMPQLDFPSRTPMVRELDLVRVGQPATWSSACSTAGGEQPMPRDLAGFVRAGPIEHTGRFSIERLRASSPRPLPYRINAQHRFEVAGHSGILLVESR